MVTEKFVAPSLQGNHAGDDPRRRITIFLPPGYEESNRRYPVIYFLHGGMERQADSVNMRWFGIKSVLDAAMGGGHIHPVIFVVPNSTVDFGTSFYINSTLTGNRSDYIAKDVVTYVDKRYRTIADKNSRGLCGHSGGGHGALKISMLYPNVFGTIYALSPAVIGWGGDFSINMPAFHGFLQKSVQHRGNI